MDVFSHLYATPARNSALWSSSYPFGIDASSRFIAEQILDDSSSSIDEFDHGDVPSSSRSSSPRSPFVPQIGGGSAVGATAGDRSTCSEPLLEPVEDLRGYVCTAYVPPIPADLKGEWERRAKRVPSGSAVAKGKARALSNPVNIEPSEGRRTLVGIERIEMGDLRRHCDAWTNTRIPRRVDLESLHHTRPDLFVNFNSDESENGLIPDDLVFDPIKVAWRMKARNFDALREREIHSSYNSSRASEDSSSSTEVESVKSATRRRQSVPDSSSSSSAPSSRSSSPSTSSQPNGDVSEGDDPTSRLLSALRNTLFGTASSVLNVSEGRATRGWRWMDKREAWDHARARKVDIHGLTVDGSEEDEVDACLKAPFEDVDWMVWAKPGDVDPVNGRDKGALGMLVVFLPPWVFPQQNVSDFTAPQEWSDGIRGESKFLPHEALIAAVYDLCRELNLAHFALATYTHLAVGTFNKSYTLAFMSHSLEATSPPPPSVHSTALNLGFGSRPNALRTLAFWMRCSMGNCEDAWPIPVERPVRSHLSEENEASEVLRTAMRRVDELLEDPTVAAAIRASESYALAEESDFVLVRTVQVAHRMDVEHRNKYPRSLSVTHAVPEEGEEGANGHGYVLKSRELKWNFLPHEIVSVKASRKRRRLDQGDANLRPNKRAKSPRDVDDQGSSKDKAPPPRPKAASRSRLARSVRPVGQSTTRSIDVATMRATAPPEDDQTRDAGSTPSSPSESEVPSPREATPPAAPARPRRARNGRIVSGSTEATAATWGTDGTLRRSGRKIAAPDTFVSDWAGPKRRR